MRLITGLFSLSIAIYLATFLSPSGYPGQWDIDFMRSPGSGHPYSISPFWLWIFIVYGIYCIALGEYDYFINRLDRDEKRRKKAGESATQTPGA